MMIDLSHSPSPPTDHMAVVTVGADSAQQAGRGVLAPEAGAAALGNSSAAATDNRGDVSAAQETSVASEPGNSSAAATDNHCDLSAAQQPSVAAELCNSSAAATDIRGDLSAAPVAAERGAAAAASPCEAEVEI
eukprot:1837926-Rhodomonas_salina.1